MGYRVAVVGATGAVGREMMAILEETNFRVDAIHAVASRKSVGVEVSFGDRIIRCEDMERFDFSKVDVVLMSAGAEVSRAWSEKIGKAGPIVIDNSSAWRMHPQVPLVVPEANPDAAEDFRAKNIIANPNCSTIQLVVALKPLHDAARIKRVVVSTYQSVSGKGKEAMDELWDQTKALYGLGEKNPKQFTKQIAFNLIPHIDDFLEDGSTKEEWKMAVETKKILDPAIEVSATCVRVPVFVGHALAVNVELEHEIDLEAARDALQEFEGVLLVDDPANGEYVTPIECVGEFGVLVSRLRRDTTVPSGLSMWVVADNLRKGAALNAVQIAELLVQEGHL